MAPVKEQKSRWVEQNGWPNGDSHKHNQPIFDRGTKGMYNGEKTVFSTNTVGRTGHSHEKEMNLEKCWLYSVYKKQLKVDHRPKYTPRR